MQVGATKATGHSYGNSVVTKQPTCTSEGTKTKTCTKCNATVTEKLPAKGHTAVNDKGYPATCTIAGKTDGSHCSVCNTVIKVQTVINATGHKSSGWIVDKAAYLCEVFGIVSVTVALHFVQVFIAVPSDVQVGCFVTTEFP